MLVTWSIIGQKSLLNTSLPQQTAMGPCSLTPFFPHPFLFPIRVGWGPIDVEWAWVWVWVGDEALVFIGA